MEDHVGILVFPGSYVHPELSHKENLIGIVWHSSVSGRSRFLDPICQVPNEVKEEVRVGHRDDFVSNLDEDTEASPGEKVQFLHDGPHQVLGFGGGVNKESLRVRGVRGKTEFDLTSSVLSGK